MSFDSLNKDELTDVAEFFVKDVEAADPEKGPTKKELVAALASDSDGSDPVSWDDYKNVYLPAKESGQDKSKETRRAEKAAAEAAKAAEEAAAQADTEDDSTEAAAAEDDADAAETAAEEESAEDKPVEVIVKCERKNPTFEVWGYTFTHKHPFASVPERTAEHLIKNVKGFRVALPSEVQEYYG